MKSILTSLFIVIGFSIFGQQKVVLKILEDLCAPHMHGRGYVNKGDSIAAEYIQNKYKQYGAIPFGDSYLQHFNLDVNTFPTELNVILDKDTLKVGDDYVVESNSGSAKGKFVPIKMDNNDLANSFAKLKAEPKKAIAVIDISLIKNRDSLQELWGVAYYIAKTHPVIIVKSGKHTWSVGRKANENPIIEIKQKAFNYDCNSIELQIENEFVTNYQSQNVIGYIPGKKKNKYVVFTGHYDHLGRMGPETYFPGANDNASGIAIIINLMKHFQEHPPKYSIVFMSFGAEEAGLVGSRFYTENPLFKLKKIKFLLNLDIMGSGEKGITVVNAPANQKKFDLLQNTNKEFDYLTVIKPRNQTQNSDHYYFSEKNVPAVFIYTMGSVTAYHDIFDKSEELSMKMSEPLTKLLLEFVKRL